jgi:hypothetical protein
MSNVELIAELTDICIRQAEIIKAQADILEQLGAEAREEEALTQRNRLEAITGAQMRPETVDRRTTT